MSDSSHNRSACPLQGCQPSPNVLNRNAGFKRFDAEHQASHHNRRRHFVWPQQDIGSVMLVHRNPDAIAAICADHAQLTVTFLRLHKRLSLAGPHPHDDPQHRQRVDRRNRVHVNTVESRLLERQIEANLRNTRIEREGIGLSVCLHRLTLPLEPASAPRRPNKQCLAGSELLKHEPHRRGCKLDPLILFKFIAENLEGANECGLDLDGLFRVGKSDLLSGMHLVTADRQNDRVLIMIPSRVCHADTSGATGTTAVVPQNQKRTWHTSSGAFLKPGYRVCLIKKDHGASGLIRNTAQEYWVALVGSNCMRCNQCKTGCTGHHRPGRDIVGCDNTGAKVRQ